MLGGDDEALPDATSTVAAPANQTATTLVVARHHAYEDAKVDSLGEGWLGFNRHTITDLRTGTWQRTRYDYNTLARTALGGRVGYPFKGLPVDTFTVAPPSGTS